MQKSQWLENKDSIQSCTVVLTASRVLRFYSMDEEHDQDLSFWCVFILDESHRSVAGKVHVSASLTSLSRRLTEMGTITARLGGFIIAGKLYPKYLLMTQRQPGWRIVETLCKFPL